MAIISGSIRSLLKTSGFPIPDALSSGSELTVSLLNGPGYLTLESKRNFNGFYTSSANYASVSSSNMVDRSNVSSGFIASAYMGYTETGSLTIAAARDLPANEVLIRVVSPNIVSFVEYEAGLIDSLLASLQARSTYYENGDGATLILQQFENCES